VLKSYEDVFLNWMLKYYKALFEKCYALSKFSSNSANNAF